MKTRLYLQRLGFKEKKDVSLKNDATKSTETCVLFTKGPVHIWGETCPRPDPHIAYMGYYFGPHMYKYT